MAAPLSAFHVRIKYYFFTIKANDLEKEVTLHSRRCKNRDVSVGMHQLQDHAAVPQTRLGERRSNLAKAKIGMKNPAYNMRGLCQLRHINPSPA
jgi:hypothetical protein